MTILQFVYLVSIHEHLCFFQFAAIMDKAAMNIFIKSFCGHKFLFNSGKYPGLGLPGLNIY